MRKTSWSVAILMFGITAVLVTKFIVLGDSNIDSESGVITLNVSQSNQDYILNEMDEFLVGLALVNESIITKDNSYLKLAAENSGGLDLMRAPKGILKSLPIAFKKMGASARLSFDDLVDTHMDVVDPKLLEKQMGDMLLNCNKCHTEYDFNRNKSYPNKNKELFVENMNQR